MLRCTVNCTNCTVNSQAQTLYKCTNKSKMTLKGMVLCRLHIESPMEYNKTPVVWEGIMSVSLAIGRAFPETDLRLYL